MSAPTQITVVYLSGYTAGSGSPASTTTVVVPVPSVLQGLDSTTAGVTQTGFNAWDSLLAGIVKRGGVGFVNAAGTQVFIPITQVVSITSP